MEDATDEAEETTARYGAASVATEPDGDSGARSTRSNVAKDGWEGDDTAPTTFWAAPESSWAFVGLLGEAACGDGLGAEVAETNSSLVGDVGDRGGVRAISGTEGPAAVVVVPGN